MLPPPLAFPAVGCLGMAVHAGLLPVKSSIFSWAGASGFLVVSGGYRIFFCPTDGIVLAQTHRPLTKADKVLQGGGVKKKPFQRG